MNTKTKTNVPYDNLPSARARRLMAEYVSMKTREYHYKDQANALWNELITLGVGHYQGGTIYEVGPVRVRSHIRRAFKAIRTSY